MILGLSGNDDHDDDDDDGVSFVSIIGMGGLGKTALAKILYNDYRIIAEFQLRMWVCLSDSDSELDLKLVISMLLNSVSPDAERDSISDTLGLTQLKGLLRDMLAGKKYFLVLDNVWTEDPAFWFSLKDALSEAGGATGSTVLLTTRSRMVAEAIGKCGVYKLQGLSEADSWELFSKAAFGGVENQKLAHIGKGLLKKCASVPLAIQVVGRQLYGQGLKKWLQFDRAGLVEIDQQVNGIFPVLKRSFDRLPSALKSCFVFCGIFPKGKVIEKKKLIKLWMAHGYVHPVGFQSLEEAGEEYFMSLFKRSFFEAGRVDHDGGIQSCKMHDWMYDLAQAMAGDEYQAYNSYLSTIDAPVRHLSIIRMGSDAACLLGSKGLRTLLNFEYSSSKQIIPALGHLRRLRVLDLEFLDVTSLPHDLGDLCHLRYLNLTCNSKLELLPSSLTKLVNLQTLDLSGCAALKCLPYDLSKLVKLRHLHIEACCQLTHMPLGIKNLTSLCELDTFVVGDASTVCSIESLEDLKSLTKLRGQLTVWLHAYPTVKNGETKYLRAKEHLTDLKIYFCNNGNPLEQTDDKISEQLLECLEPPPNVMKLALTGYGGVRIPSWTSWKSSCSCLVNIHIINCPRLQHLPNLRKLSHLKNLKLIALEDLEYVETDDLVKSDSQSFFPSLESLELVNLPNLRGWSSSRLVELSSLQAFLHLHELYISGCPKLTSLPTCENINQLHLYSFNDALQLVTSHSPQQQYFSVLTRVTTDNVGYIKILPVEFYENISSLMIHRSNIEWLSYDDVFGRDMLSLESLEIRWCRKLSSISGTGWKHLVALQSLQLSDLPNLCLSTMAADGEEDLLPWDSLQGLHHLKLDYLPKLVKLPKGIQYLRFLRTFEITDCDNLKELPEWIACLNELQSLYIKACTQLKCLPESMEDLTALRDLRISRSGSLMERIRPPDGEDWPKIQHIPHVMFDDQLR